MQLFPTQSSAILYNLHNTINFTDPLGSLAGILLPVVQPIPSVGDLVLGPHRRGSLNNERKNATYPLYHSIRANRVLRYQMSMRLYFMHRLKPWFPS